MRRARPAFQGRLEGASTSFVLVGSGYGQPMPEPHGAVLPYGASQTPLAPLQLCPLRLPVIGQLDCDQGCLARGSVGGNGNQQLWGECGGGMGVGAWYRKWEG